MAEISGPHYGEKIYNTPGSLWWRARVDVDLEVDGYWATLSIETGVDGGVVSGHLALNISGTINGQSAGTFKNSTADCPGTHVVGSVNIIDPGTYSFSATNTGGSWGQNGTSSGTFTIVDPIKYGGYDVNPIIDGTTYASGLSGFTFDVYKAGSLVKDNVTDAAESGIEEGTSIRVVANNTTGYSLSNGDVTKTIPADSTATFTPTWSKNTYYVYYKQGTASSTANLPGTQSGLYKNSIALASNNMSKNTDIIGTYTTTFNYNGSGQANSSLTSNRKTDYTANGWTTTSGSTTKTHNNGQAYTMPANNITLYPCFSQNTYYTSITLPTPSRADYVFDGWYTAASGGVKIGNGGSTYAPMENNTFYARWIPEKYVGVSSNGATIKTHNMYISENGKPFTLVLKSKCKVFVNGTQKL